MAIAYRAARAEDIETLVRLRVDLLRRVNGLAADADMSRVETENRRYFTQNIEAPDTQLTCLALDGETPVGCGSVCLFAVTPTYHNPAGKCAYIMNMYTLESHRRRGIGRQLMQMLLHHAQQWGAQRIMLEASEEGRLLYEQCGFVSAEYEMEYDPLWLQEAPGGD